MELGDLLGRQPGGILLAWLEEAPAFGRQYQLVKNSGFVGLAEATLATGTAREKEDVLGALISVASIDEVLKNETLFAVKAVSLLSASTGVSLVSSLSHQFLSLHKIVAPRALEANYLGMITAEATAEVKSLLFSQFGAVILGSQNSHDLVLDKDSLFELLGTLIELIDEGIASGNCELICRAFNFLQIALSCEVCPLGVMTSFGSESGKTVIDAASRVVSCRLAFRSKLEALPSHNPTVAACRFLSQCGWDIPRDVIIALVTEVTSFTLPSQVSSPPQFPSAGESSIRFEVALGCLAVLTSTDIGKQSFAAAISLPSRPALESKLNEAAVHSSGLFLESAVGVFSNLCLCPETATWEALSSMIDPQESSSSIRAASAVRALCSGQKRQEHLLELSSERLDLVAKLLSVVAVAASNNELPSENAVAATAAWGALCVLVERLHSLSTHVPAILAAAQKRIAAPCEDAKDVCTALLYVIKSHALGMAAQQKSKIVESVMNSCLDKLRAADNSSALLGALLSLDVLAQAKDYSSLLVKASANIMAALERAVISIDSSLAKSLAMVRAFKILAALSLPPSPALWETAQSLALQKGSTALPVEAHVSSALTINAVQQLVSTCAANLAFVRDKLEFVEALKSLLSSPLTFTCWCEVAGEISTLLKSLKLSLPQAVTASLFHGAFSPVSETPGVFREIGRVRALSIAASIRENSATITEHSSTIQTALVAAFDSSAQGQFRSGMGSVRRNLLLDILNGVSTADAHSRLTLLTSHTEIARSLEAHLRHFSTVDGDSVSISTVNKAITFLGRMCAVSHRELYVWICAACSGSRFESWRTVSIFSECIKNDDIKAWALKREAELGLSAALELAAGRAEAFGDLQTQACKALNALQHTASPGLVGALAATIEGADANSRLRALQALSTLSDLAANVVSIPASLDLSVLERVVLQRTGELDARMEACVVMQKLKHMPSAAMLDALVDGAARRDNARPNAISCIKRLCLQDELRERLAQPERRVVKTMLDIIASEAEAGRLRYQAVAVLWWLMSSGQVKPFMLEPSLRAVDILSGAVTNHDGVIIGKEDSRNNACNVLQKLGVTVDESVLVALVKALSEESGTARLLVLKGLELLAKTQAISAALGSVELGLASALSALVGCSLIEQDTALKATELLANRALCLSVSPAALAQLSGLLRSSAGQDRVLVMNRLANLCTDAFRKAVKEESAGVLSALQFMLLDEGGSDSTIRVKALELFGKLSEVPSQVVIQHLVQAVRSGLASREDELSVKNALESIKKIASTITNRPSLLQPEHNIIALLQSCLSDGARVESRRASMWILYFLCSLAEVKVTMSRQTKDALVEAMQGLLRVDGMVSGNCRWIYILVANYLSCELDIATIRQWCALAQSEECHSIRKDVVDDLVRLLGNADQKAWALKRDAELGLSAALELAAGRAEAFGDLQTQACKALNALQHTASASLVGALAATIEGADANSRLRALQALSTLSDLAANVVSIPASLDLSVLERVVLQRTGELDARMEACVVMQKLKHMPSAAMLDALVDGAARRDNARPNAISCIGRLCRQDELRERLAQPERRVVKTMRDIIASEAGRLRHSALDVLWWLMSSGQVKPLMLEPSLRAVDILSGAVTNHDGVLIGKEDSRYNACFVLWKLGVTVDESVLVALVKALSEESGQLQQNAIKALSFLANIQSNATRLALPQLGLSVALQRMLEANLCVAEVGALIDRLKMVPSVGMLSALEAICKSETGESRKTAVEILLKLANSDINKARMRDSSTGVVDAMNEIVRDASPSNSSRAIACTVFSALDLPPDAESLRSVLDSSASHDATVQKEALSCISNLANSHAITVSALSNESVAAALHRVALEKQGAVMYLACEAIGQVGCDLEADLIRKIDAQISSDNAAEAKLAASTLNVCLGAAKVARKISRSRDAVHVHLKDTLQQCAWIKVNVDTVDEYVQSLMRCLGKLGMLPRLPTLTRVVKLLTEGDPASKSNALNALNNIISNYSSFDYHLHIGEEHFGVTSAILCVAQDKSAGLVGWCYMALMNLAKQEGNISGMLASSAHTVAMDHLRQTGGDALTLRKYESGSFTYSYTVLCLMNMAQWPEARDELRRAGAVSFFKQCYLHESTVGLYASVLLSFLVGNDESGADKDLLESSPATILRITDCLASTANRVGGDGYKYGIFGLEQILRAVFTICISDANKIRFSTPRVVAILVQILGDFNNNRVRGKMGGGGEDVRSAETCAEILLLLSFAIEEDDELRRLMGVDSGAVVALELFQQRTSGDFKISVDAERTCSLLLSRLYAPKAVSLLPQDDGKGTVALIGGSSVLDLNSLSAAPGSPSALGPASSSAGAAKHIMLSYCWSDSSRPELVAALATELRRLGYDVWRDVEGSSILEGMSGSTEDRMAEAVERSSHVIICVSRMYKERPNCRAEAQYANKLKKKKGSRLKILFLMMEETYTTETEDSVDGWLAFMISDQLWYPLWEEAQVQLSSQKLATIIGTPSSLAAGPPSQVGGSPVAPRSASISSQGAAGGGALSASQKTASAGGGGAASSVTAATSGNSNSSAVQGPAAAVSASASVAAPLPAPTSSPSPSTQTAPRLSVAMPDPVPAPVGGFSPPPVRSYAFSSSPSPRRLSASLTSPVSLSSSSPLPSVSLEISHSQAWTWQVLHDPEATIDQAALQSLLGELGVNCPSDMEALRQEDVARVKALLRPAKRRPFELGAYDRAWELLCDPFNATDASELQAALTELGASYSADLVYLDDEDVTRIAMLLKKVKKRAFLELMGSR